MNRCIAIAIVIFSYKGVFGQINDDFVCQCAKSISYRRSINVGFGSPYSKGTIMVTCNHLTMNGVIAISNYFMLHAYYNPSPYPIRSVNARFPNFCNNKKVFEKFIYQILIEGQGDKKTFTRLITDLFGNNVSGELMYNYLIGTYSNTIKKDIAKINAYDKTLNANDNDKPVPMPVENVKPALPPLKSLIKDTADERELINPADIINNENKIKIIRKIIDRDNNEYRITRDLEKNSVTIIDKMSKEEFQYSITYRNIETYTFYTTQKATYIEDYFVQKGAKRLSSSEGVITLLNGSLELSSKDKCILIKIMFDVHENKTKVIFENTCDFLGN